MLNVAKCPTCGTEFEAKLNADGKPVMYPWNTQKLHCTKHDMLYVNGGECPACAGEVGEEQHEGHTASETPKQHHKALDDAINKAKANVNRTPMTARHQGPQVIR